MQKYTRDLLAFVLFIAGLVGVIAWFLFNPSNTLENRTFLKFQRRHAPVTNEVESATSTEEASDESEENEERAVEGSKEAELI